MKNIIWNRLQKSTSPDHTLLAQVMGLQEEDLVCAHEVVEVVMDKVTRVEEKVV